MATNFSSSLGSYVLNKFQSISKWSDTGPSWPSCYTFLDPVKAQSRLEAMEAARRRLQEKFDGQAAEYAEKAKIVSHQIF